MIIFVEFLLQMEKSNRSLQMNSSNSTSSILAGQKRPSVKPSVTPNVGEFLNSYSLFYVEH